MLCVTMAVVAFESRLPSNELATRNKSGMRSGLPFFPRKSNVRSDGGKFFSKIFEPHNVEIDDDHGQRPAHYFKQTTKSL